MKKAKKSKGSFRPKKNNQKGEIGLDGRHKAFTMPKRTRGVYK